MYLHKTVVTPEYHFTPVAFAMHMAIQHGIIDTSPKKSEVRILSYNRLDDQPVMVLSPLSQLYV